ncbi:hypothetical protein K4K53_000416 [Colletotrichum sp. SAR 10_77]|nr:hypothetical protein K4K53_000416 [Colletotrichum sp. SAR 10_77]KAJ5001893.1 hypothetical protein K4K48_000807 [Colletotrichum sp. SAR 10_66]
MAPPVDWDARPRAWLMYLKHLKDTDETAYQALIAKLDAGELADVKWAASAQRTGDQDQADETESVVFSDTEEELQWQDPKAFFRSWAHATAKEHRVKIREQRQEIEARKKELAAVRELATDPAVPDQTTTTTTNILEPPVPSPPTTQPGPRQSAFLSSLAANTTAALGLSTAPPSTHTGTVPEHHGRARHHDQGGRQQTGLGDQYGRKQTGLGGNRRASPAGAWSTSPVMGPAADVQAIKDIGRRRYAEQSKREDTEEEEMMDRLGRLRAG